MRVLIVDGNHQYKEMFLNRGWELATNIFEADLIQFTGGEDVTPEIYEEINTASGCNFERDLMEAGIFAIANRLEIPMAGICRGGQFLNVMSGGKMHQHVEGHAIYSGHKAVTPEGRSIHVSSTHHQIMYPSKKGEVLLEANEKVIPVVDQVEAVFYSHTNCLCFQPHPEFYKKGHECQDFYFELLEKFLLVKGEE